ncbi:hypothetical protein [Haloferax sp. KTX1]|uniref:hypothetical protein n=1 Tax=Haloferax sp. KTX1 TaxID=2600597 RepID=UPI002102F136|nr:hypothetical protein [Haloferax sp. KTX1]
MNCLDTNALIDYLEGEPEIATFLETSQQPYFAPTVALHEILVGAARLRGAEGSSEPATTWTGWSRFR